MKKSNRKILVKKLDDLVSKIIRQRETSCVTCGSEERLGAGHIFSRKAYSTRWDVTEDGNVHTQCWPCNYRHVSDQYVYFKWYIDKFGMNKFLNLRERFKGISKLKDFQLEELLEELKNNG